ncbi:TIGR01244 family sulfur transferase [Erythrobacter sp. LQ02-29]|uniref:TIGR01244 family sulfur transferase n=1 Tax=Erythrobacter sp. LQ02-29 TaxID=2920384 RepID=UPI001F4DE492|nr:TIGR01244 family sulfur transferase [Erythrobacter sp. LQ02-29]
MIINRVDENFAVAPQIAPQDMAALAADGFTTVICNRPDGEEPGQPDVATMRAAAEAEGMAFHHIPISGGVFPPESVAAQRAARQRATGRTLAYCRSGTRSITLDAIANPDDHDLEERLRLAADAGYDLSALRGRVG